MTLEEVKLEDLRFPSCQLIQFLFHSQPVSSCTVFITLVSVTFHVAMKFPWDDAISQAIKSCTSVESQNRPVTNILNVEENDLLHPNSIMALLTELNTHHHHNQL